MSGYEMSKFLSDTISFPGTTPYSSATLTPFLFGSVYQPTNFLFSILSPTGSEVSFEP